MTRAGPPVQACERDAARRPAVGSAPAPTGLAMRLLRGLSGSLAAGLVVLAVLLGVVHWLSGPDTVPGPGVGALVGHWVGAIVAVALQWFADRRRGVKSGVAALAVLAVVVAVLWTWWWL